MRRVVPLLVLLLAACGSSPAGAPAPSSSPAPSAGTVVGFRACEETPAAPGTTHLQAFDHVELPPYSPDLPGLSGPVLVRHVMTLHLPTGSVLVTDGGSGGFWSPTAAAVEPSEDPSDLGPAFEACTAAAFPEGGPSPLCVIRSSDGVEDGIVFSTGIGDGGYPTYAGRDADGNVVALLNDGGMPWATAGVPGTPPPDYVEPDYAEPA
ncbi:DUF4241 domain-containing protein [Kineococcus sp. GCM10028916]|uniref:DUF4241 domain-containing protein n=1 Tax=Kineococcus sp. GCM10028916 TaxID=3273394 RepID=UPI00363B9817